MKAVVVHSGRRDDYQVARALAEEGMLDRLVTDLYWPADTAWAKWFAATGPKRVGSLLSFRNSPGLSSELVESCWVSGLASLLLSKTPGVSPEWKRRAMRWSDKMLGSAARRRALATQSIQFSYSYYGYHSFSSNRNPKILFQLHPHPASVRKILARELEEHPETAASLKQEWELALPEEDFARLVLETTMPDRWICASSFTRRTLVENGIDQERVQVIPYGVDAEEFQPGPSEGRQGFRDRPLRLLFVGRMVQRKGITYLLEALKKFGPDQVELIVAGRPVDDLRLLSDLGDRIQVRCFVPQDELRHLYQSSDLFVLPSVAEGFGQVLLEALASGLPVLTTTHTAGPDLISHGVQGWIVEPRRPEQLVQWIDWALSNRAQLEAMRRAARESALRNSWSNFRKQIVEAVRLSAGEPQTEPGRVFASV